MKHTPTPWAVGASKRSVISADPANPKVLTRMNFNGLGSGTYEDEEPEANAQRIVECVNALEGIEDPKQFVSVAKQYIEFEANLKQSLVEMDEQATDYRLKLAQTEVERDELVTTMNRILAIVQCHQTDVECGTMTGKSCDCGAEQIRKMITDKISKYI